MFFDDDSLNIINENNDKEINDDHEDKNESDQDNQNDDHDNDNATDVPVKVEPKRRVIRNPQLKLNVERLKGSRGIQDVETYFQDIQFLGKSHEKEDLNNIMKRLEHWAHRLYPKYNFDDCLLKIEQLGKKKQMQTHMTKYRLNMLEIQLNKDKDIISAEEDDDVIPGNEDEELARPIDEFDALITDQIEQMSKIAPKTPGGKKNVSFGSNRATPQAIFINRHSLKPSGSSTPDTTISNKPEEEPTRLSSEQMAQIAENRRIAMERIRARKENAKYNENHQNEL